MRSSRRCYGVTLVFMIWACYALSCFFSSDDWSISSLYLMQDTRPLHKVVHRNRTLGRKRNGITNKEQKFKEEIAKYSHQASWKNFLSLTVGKMSTFQLNDPKKAYEVGDQLAITIQARDGNGNNKSTGGDYFRALMYSDVQKTSVNPDRIIDRNNGTYVAFFTARWSGQTNITVVLVHPIEAINVINKVMSHFPNRRVYNGVFVDHGKKLSDDQSNCDVVVPNDQVPICNYSDNRYHTPLYCTKPAEYRCEQLWRIQPDNLQAREQLDQFLANNEKAAMARIKEALNSTISLDVIDSRPGKEHSDEDLEFCKLNQIPRDMNAHGYFIDRIWRPFNCKIAHFNSEESLRCLANKSIYIFGDSTGLQFIKYLESQLDGFTKLMDENYTLLGPHECYNQRFNITLYHQFHGFPVGVRYYIVSRAPFVFNALDKLKGGRGAIVLLTLLAHFKKTSLALYEKRILAVLDAVRRLLQRAPETIVIFKGANTRELPDNGDFFWPMCSSDWLSYQFEVLLRRLIRESKLKVGFIDAWDLTNARHHSEDNIHPNGIIVGTMIDQILTHMCA